MFTKKIYQTVLNDKIKHVDKRLSEIVLSTSLSERFHPMLMDAVLQGRRFRPLLMIIVNKGVGGKWRQIIDPACAIELLHKASLIHDDIIDEDVLRRGKPSFWKIYGKKQAIVTGDFLIGLSLNTMYHWCSQNDSQKTRQIFEVYSSTLNETIIGEIYDIQFEADSDVAYDDIEQMIAIKSGSLIAASMQIGAISGGASQELVETLTRLGRCVGIIFQTINDMNSVTGRDGPSKGMNNNDVLQKKKTPVTYILQQSGISSEQFSEMSKNDILEILDPVLAGIDKKIEEAESYINQLPGGFMKKLFTKLLKEAQSDWFWIDQND
jgi:geranylgeranyl pyrophosphate synthase